MSPFPGWSWFLQPSGGPVQPGFWGWVDGIRRRPIVAHPLGAFVVTWAFAHQWPPTAGIAAALLAEAVNQFYKANGGAYDGRRWAAWETWSNVLWRLGLAFAGAGLGWVVA